MPLQGPVPLERRGTHSALEGVLVGVHNAVHLMGCAALERLPTAVLTALEGPGVGVHNLVPAQPTLRLERLPTAFLGARERLALQPSGRIIAVFPFRALYNFQKFKVTETQENLTTHRNVFIFMHFQQQVRRSTIQLTELCVFE